MKLGGRKEGRKRKWLGGGEKEERKCLKRLKTQSSHDALRS